MIFQDPLTSLNPVLTIGLQLTEGILQHEAHGQGHGLAARRGPAPDGRHRRCVSGA